MPQQVTGSRSRVGLTRRSIVRSTAAMLSMPFVPKGWAQDKLAGSGEVVVFSYGGSYTAGVRQHVYEPFTKATGIKVVDVVADFPDPAMRAMFRAGKVDWDFATPAAANYPSMKEAGMFVPIDYSLWDQESIQGTPQHTRLKDAVVAFQSAIVLAYDQRAFPKDGPQNWVDFWDVKKFPGPRGLLASEAKRNIPFALLADGVAPKDIWPLTDAKLDRAFKKLDEIKPHVSKWWTAGGEAPQLLINREYAATTAYDGRAVSAMRQGAPIKIVWSGAYLAPTWGTIMKGGPNTANAQKFVAFLNRAPIAAGYTQATGYPGPNTNQLKHLPPDLVPLVSVNPENTSKCVLEDSAWLGAKRPDGKTNLEHIQERWLAWRARS